MKISPLEKFRFCDKKIGFLGLGVSNLALISLMPRDAKIIIRSEKKIDSRLLPYRFSELELREGRGAFSRPEEHTLFLSPSVRRDRAELVPFKQAGVKFSSDAEVFFSDVASPVFAVSGSDGKSTTATIVSLLLTDKFKNPALIGNIGEAMTPSLNKRHDAYAVELSSFMLSYLRINALRAAITNITPNHLDWHRSFAEYRDTKLSLLKTAHERIICADDDVLESFLTRNEAFAVTCSRMSYRDMKRKYAAAVYYSRDDEFIYRDSVPILPIKKIRIPYSHNVDNFMTAIAMCDGYVSRERIAKVAESFTGLPHRAELFFSYGGVDFYDSSIDSTPARCANTLSALKRRCIVILGGRGKGLSYEPLGEALKKYATFAIVTGENAEEIASSIKGSCAFTVISDFTEAIRAATEMAKDGDSVILSPASTSFDKFKDYKERGKKFKDIITEIYSKRDKNLE